jgi:hypothetical protein
MYFLKTVQQPGRFLELTAMIFNKDKEWNRVRLPPVRVRIHGLPAAALCRFRPEAGASLGVAGLWPPFTNNRAAHFQ